MTTAERNRKLKTVLSKAFRNHKVRVHGSRGTAYGWVHINIDATPRGLAHRRRMVDKVWRLIEKNDIRIGTYGYDDPGSDYGFGRTIHINFNDIGSAP